MLRPIACKGIVNFVTFIWLNRLVNGGGFLRTPMGFVNISIKPVHLSKSLSDTKKVSFKQCLVDACVSSFAKEGYASFTQYIQANGISIL